MTTIIPRSLFLILCISTAPAFAQNGAAPTATPESGPVTQTKRNRAISGETSSAISAGYSYQPPKPVAPVEDEMADQREVDKPRNEIIRLPKYMVEGTRPPVFAERNMYTKADFSDLIRQRYLGRNGLNKYQLGKSGEVYAMQMYWDDERMKDMMGADQQVSLYRVGGDAARAAKVEEENQSMFLRVNDAQSAELSKAAGQRY
jgi:hypothetical protein